MSSSIEHTRRRIVGCANPWHTTAPARESQDCPECPADPPVVIATGGLVVVIRETDTGALGVSVVAGDGTPVTNVTRLDFPTLRRALALGGARIALDTIAPAPAPADELGALDELGGALTDPEEQAGPITDAGGYLACGCHGSQREHSCHDREPAGDEL